MEQPGQENPPNHPQNPPMDLPNQPNPPPNQPPNLPANLPDPMANQYQLNWSYFKPEFSGKPEEDAEAHLLRTNDWMETHDFPQDTEVRRFCLTLMGEARLWYETPKSSAVRLGMPYKNIFSNSIQNLAALENSIFMFGDPFTLMKM